MVLTDLVPQDVLTLADLLQAEWPAARERIRLSGHPTCEGDADDAGTDDAGGDTDDGAADEGAASNDDAGKDDKAADTVEHWKRMARRHERDAKKARDAEKATVDKLKEREDADKSEHEKAIEAARSEGEQTALSKFEETRRDDRIEMEVIKLAGRDIKIGDGDKATTAKFADPDDAHLRLERAIRKGDLSYDDLYDDGKVKKDAVTEFLTDLLAENPHLRAPTGNGRSGNGAAKEDVVDMDGGKGKGPGGGKSLEDMSPEDHLKELQAR